MRSSFWRSLAVLPTVAGLAIPGFPSRPDAPSIVDLDLRDSRVKASFQVPCSGCRGQDAIHPADDSLLLDFQVFASEAPCGVANITLNDLFLAQKWDGIHASGHGTLRTPQRGPVKEPDLIELSWNSTCLSDTDVDELDREDDDVAQLLTVTIDKVNGKAPERPSGFTISFRNIAPPELLRLALRPEFEAASSKFSEEWRDPPVHLRLVAPPRKDDDGTPAFDNSIEAEIRELKRLQADARELRQRIRQKKGAIHALLKSRYTTFRQQLQQCDSLSCVFKTITDKASGAIRVMWIRFSPVHHQPPQREHDHNHDHAEMPSRFPPPGAAPQAEFEMPPFEHRGPPPMYPVHHGHVAMADEKRPPSPPHFDGPPPHHLHGMHHGPPPSEPHHPSHPPHLIWVTLSVLSSCVGLTCLFACIRRSSLCSARRKVDRATRREERRNARLYRRAARRQAWRDWWHGHSSRGDEERLDDYEEKRCLILDREDMLEDAMQEEIRMLRETCGVVSGLVGNSDGSFPRSYPTPPPPPSGAQPQHNPYAPPPPPPSHFFPQTQNHPFPPPPPLPVPRGPYAPYPITNQPSVAAGPSELPAHVARSRTSSLPSYTTSAPSFTSIDIDTPCSSSVYASEKTPSSSGNSVIDEDDEDEEDAPPAYEDEIEGSNVVVNGFRGFVPSVSGASSSPSNGCGSEASGSPLACAASGGGSGSGLTMENDGDEDDVWLDEDDEDDDDEEDAAVRGRMARRLSGGTAVVDGDDDGEEEGRSGSKV